MSIITRQQYMQNDCSHEQYYNQFVTDDLLNSLLENMGVDRIVNSTDPHFNDIPLQKWDKLSYLVRGKSTYLLSIANNREGISLSDRVCTLKAAAKKIRREHAKSRKWDISVRFMRSEYILNTEINGTVDSILDYYQQNDGWINVGSGPGDNMQKIIGIDFTPAD